MHLIVFLSISLWITICFAQEVTEIATLALPDFIFDNGVGTSQHFDNCYATVGGDYTTTFILPCVGLAYCSNGPYQWQTYQFYASDFSTTFNLNSE